MWREEMTHNHRRRSDEDDGCMSGAGSANKNRKKNLNNLSVRSC